MWAGSGVTLLGMGHQEPGVGDVPFEGGGGGATQRGGGGWGGGGGGEPTNRVVCVCAMLYPDKALF